MNYVKISTATSTSVIVMGKLLIFFLLIQLQSFFDNNTKCAADG